MSDYRTDVIELMEAAGAAHHAAFAHVNGEDDEWPMWYARFARDKLNTILPGNITESQLVYALVKADKAFKVQQPETTWQVYYADLILSEFTA